MIWMVARQNNHTKPYWGIASRYLWCGLYCIYVYAAIQLGSRRISGPDWLNA